MFDGLVKVDEDVHDLHSHVDDVMVDGVDDVVVDDVMVDGVDDVMVDGVMVDGVDDVMVDGVMPQQIPAVGCATTAL